MLQGIKTFKKETLKNDLISGAIIALVSIPISMGYAQIAGLPPQYGLYGSVLPVFLFALFSSSPQYIFGVDAAPAALVGGTLAGAGIAFASAEAMAIVPVISFFVGVWLLLFYLLNFGRLTKFVSSPVMGGFITGICSTIILMQIPKLFGGQSGTGELRELLPHIAEEFQSSFNPVSLGISVFCIFVIQLFRKLAPKIPASAGVMIIAALLQYFTGFCAEYSVNTLPEVSRGLGRIALPAFTPERCYTGIVSGFTIALVIAAETLLAEQNFAMKNDYKISENSELMAFAVCNIASAAVGVCPVNGSVSRTSMNDQFGGKSQVTSITAAVVVYRSLRAVERNGISPGTKAAQKQPQGVPYFSCGVCRSSCFRHDTWRCHRRYTFFPECNYQRKQAADGVFGSYPRAQSFLRSENVCKGEAYKECRYLPL